MSLTWKTEALLPDLDCNINRVELLLERAVRAAGRDVARPAARREPARDSGAVVADSDGRAAARSCGIQAGPSRRRVPGGYPGLWSEGRGFQDMTMAVKNLSESDFQEGMAARLIRVTVLRPRPAGWAAEDPALALALDPIIPGKHTLAWV